MRFLRRSSPRKVQPGSLSEYQPARKNRQTDIRWERSPPNPTHRIRILTALFSILCTSGASTAGDNEIGIHVNLHGRADTYCLGSDLIDFAVRDHTEWEPLAFCFFQRKTAAGSWADLVEVDNDGFLVAPFWSAYLHANRVDGRLRGSLYNVPVPEEDLVPDGQEGVYRLFCGFVDPKLPPGELPSTKTAWRRAALEQLRSVSFSDLMKSSRHLVSRQFEIIRCAR